MRVGPSSADETSPGSRGAILLAGATGYLGRHVAQTLSRRGFRTLAPVRRGGAERLALPGVRYLETTLDDPHALKESLGGQPIDAIISCLASRSGAPEDAWRVDHAMNGQLLSLGQALGARRFVLLSALCVQKPKLAFQRAKLAFEAELTASGLDYVIVRPTAFFKSLSGQLERLRRGKPFLVFGDGSLTACKPISEADLARYLVDSLDCRERRNRVLPIGGPGPALTPRQQGQWLFEALGKPPRFRSVSPKLFLNAAKLLDLAGRVVPRLRDTAEFARIAHYYATESMLVWDPESGVYDADATPEFGAETLRDHYRDMLDGRSGDQELGEHRLFR